MDDTHPITRALIAAIGHSREPMVLTDVRLPDNPMIAVNPAFEALTGYPVAETVGRNCRFLQGAETDPAAPARIRRALAERRGCVEWVVNYRRDGGKFWNLLFISPVFALDGTLLHFFGNQRDITLGPPAGLPNYSLGKADMPDAGAAVFQALMLAFPDRPGDDADQARALERTVDAVRQLDAATTRLAPAPWSPGV